jgi:hypothetical protein
VAASLEAKLAVNDAKKPSILDSLISGSYSPTDAETSVPGPLRSVVAPAASPDSPDIPGPEAPGWAASHAAPLTAPKGPTLGSQDQFTAPSESVEPEQAAGGAWSDDGKTLTLPQRTPENSSGPSEEQPSFLKKLGRLAGGVTGFTDPNSSPQANLGARIGALAGRTGNALAASMGTPEEKQLAEERNQIPVKMAQIQNEREYRQGTLDVNRQNANTKGVVAATGAKTEQDKYAAGDAAMGVPEGTVRGMLDVARQNADSNTKLRNERSAQIEASLNGEVRVMPEIARAIGRDDLAGKSLPAIQYQQQVSNILKSLRPNALDLGAEGTYSVSPITGRLFKISDSSASQERAKMRLNSAVVDINPETGKQQYDLASNAVQSHALPRSAARQMLSIWQPALDSGERLQVMQANLERGLQGDQQAMLSLLANHLGMTMGLQKGARLNQAIISEAEQSRPWLEGMKAKFDDRGYLTGVVLSPQQMRQMVELGAQRYQSDVQKARYEAPFAGTNEEPMLPVNPDTLANNPMPSRLPQRAGGGNPRNPTPPKQSFANWKAAQAQSGVR